jgi:uncharacterized membrane protein YdjX (TVP38/TMEM64 family)
MSDPALPPPSAGGLSAVWLGAGFIVFVLALFLLGKSGLLPDVSSLRKTMEMLSESPWGFPAIVLVFCVAAFFGVPQFALIALSIAAFGPWYGSAFAWIANLISGTLTFYVGRFAGEAAFQRFAGKTAQRLSAFVGRNALATSATVRVVPAGPFLLINMAFGVSQAKFRDYIAGMAIGITPKILLIAFAGQSILAVVSGDPMLAVAALVATVIMVLLVSLLTRRIRARRGQSVAPDGTTTVDTGETSPDK